jgi:hypothetical protein
VYLKERQTDAIFVQENKLYEIKLCVAVVCVPKLDCMKAWKVSSTASQPLASYTSCYHCWLPTPSSRVRLAKLIVVRLFNKFSPLWNLSRLIIVFTRSFHWALLGTRWMQHIPRTLFLICILILLSYLQLGLPSSNFCTGYLNKLLYAFLISHFRSACLAHLSILNSIALIVFGGDQ